MFSNPLSPYYPSYNYLYPLSTGAGRAFAIMASTPSFVDEPTSRSRESPIRGGKAVSWAPALSDVHHHTLPSAHHFLFPYVSFLLSIKAGQLSLYCMKCVEWDGLKRNEMCFHFSCWCLACSCEQGNQFTLTSQLNTFSLLRLLWSSRRWHYLVDTVMVDTRCYTLVKTQRMDYAGVNPAVSYRLIVNDTLSVLGHIHFNKSTTVKQHANTRGNQYY